MDQINQVPTTGTPSLLPVQPAQTPIQSPTPPVSLPGFTPKKSNVKLWAGVIGGILIVVIGAAMILGKTKTYKGSLTQGELEAERLAQQEAEKPPETPPPPPPPPPPPAETKTQEQLEADRLAQQEAEKPPETPPPPPPPAETKTQEQLEAERLVAQEAEAQTKVSETKEPEGPQSGLTPLGAASPESQAIADKAKQGHPTGPTGVETKIDETGEHFLVAQAEMGVLKGLCNSTPGAKWNEAGIESSCVFEGINFKNLQAFKTKVDEISKQAQASGQKSLGAASDESLAIATIAKIEDAARYAAEDATAVAKILKQYPNNADIQAANAKAQNAAATATDALGFAKGETDLDILDTLLGKADLAASDALDAKYAAQDAADIEKDKKIAKLEEPPVPTPAEQIAELKTEIADLKDQLADAKDDDDKPLIKQLIAEITALNAKIASLGGTQVVVNVPEYKSAAPKESECADPSFVYDPFKKKCIAPTEVGASSSGGGSSGTKKSAASAQGKKGAMEIPEMWSDEVKTSTIETPEMWGDAEPAPAPKTGAKSTAYGATIQGKTGPGVLLYPIVIGAVNGLYYLARKRRKSTKYEARNPK